MKEAPMIIEKESECDFLRALLKSPQFGLPEYTADPIVQLRVGRAVAEASTQPHSRLIYRDVWTRCPTLHVERNSRPLFELTSPNPPTKMRARSNICPTTTTNAVRTSALCHQY